MTSQSHQLYWTSVTSDTQRYYCVWKRVFKTNEMFEESRRLLHSVISLEKVFHLYKLVSKAFQTFHFDFY